MQEDEVGLGILTFYYGPIKEGGIIAKYTPLGIIEETASLAELFQPINVHLPDSTILRMAYIEVKG